MARNYGLAGEELELARELYDRIMKLRREGRDTVWISILKSYLAPHGFQGSFEYIVGNPPWLSYRYIADPKYQEVVKHMIKDVYRLVVDEHLMTHMELATLFLVRAADKYLKEGGVIGFVMPRAIFSADQHDAFRSGSFTGVRLRLERIIDCDKVELLFYVPTCAVIARKGGETEYPVRGLIVEGKLPERRHKVLPLNEALNYLKIKETQFYYNRLGSRSFLDTRRVEIKPQRSHYYQHFYQGATIVPQTCWLVDVIDASKPGVVVVQSARRVEERGKIKVRILPMPVEREFIYGVLTSAEVLPFAHLPPNIAVLPIRPRGEGYELITRGQAVVQGYRHLARWLEEAERIWEEVRDVKKEKMSLYERLNYQRNLVGQSPRKRYKVVYLSSATHLAAAIVENKPLDLDVGNGRIRLSGIIVDSTLYRYDTDNMEEAYYLVALFNSNVINELIKPLQSQGQFGPRHVHKKPLEFPIPQYEPNNGLHRKLAELGGKTRMAYELLPGLLRGFGYDARLKSRGYLTPQEVGRLRSAVRDALGNLLSEIDGLVTEILGGLGGGREGLLRWI